eukprot:1149718-Pelagomonas_calceolata.AAC.2
MVHLKAQPSYQSLGQHQLQAICASRFEKTSTQETIFKGLFRFSALAVKLKNLSEADAHSRIAPKSTFSCHTRCTCAHCHPCRLDEVIEAGGAAASRRVECRERKRGRRAVPADTSWDCEWREECLVVVREGWPRGAG